MAGVVVGAGEPRDEVLHGHAILDVREGPAEEPVAPVGSPAVQELDQAQLDYKGLTADRDRLVAFLDDMANTA